MSCQDLCDMPTSSAFITCFAPAAVSEPIAWFLPSLLQVQFFIQFVHDPVKSYGNR